MTQGILARKTGSLQDRFVECLLRLEVKGEDATRIRRFATRLLKGDSEIKAIRGYAECAAVAPLLLLRFGDRRSLPTLEKCVQRTLDQIPPAVVRAAAIVYATYGLNESRAIRTVASQSLRADLGEMVQFIERLRSYVVVPDRFKNRLRHRYDAVAASNFVDMRTIVQARLLKLSGKSAVLERLRVWTANLLKERLSTFDRQMLKRLL